MLFLSSFGYYFEELTYSEKMDLNRRCTVLVWAALALLLLLPVCEGQRFPQQVPFQSLQPFIPMAEFFCQWTPRQPAAANQQQCVTAFNALNLQPNVYNFCLSVVTFCTASHLTLCPRPATATACRTCFPVFQQLCQQQG